MSEPVEEIQRELRDMKRLLYGDPTTGKGGLAQCVDTMGAQIYGTDRQPGGLVSDMIAMKKIVWTGGGIIIALQFGIQVLFHLWK